VSNCSNSYSTIAWAASAHKGVQPDVNYGPKESTPTGNMFSFFSALGDVAFAYAGHNVVLEIQATIPSTPETPSKKSMWKGVIVAYIVVALCYFPVSLVGYWVFGNDVEDNILMSLQKPVWLVAAANMFVVVHVIGSYQVRFNMKITATMHNSSTTASCIFNFLAVENQ
jgi:amino acid permease